MVNRFLGFCLNIVEIIGKAIGTLPGSASPYQEKIYYNNLLKQPFRVAENKLLTISKYRDLYVKIISLFGQ